MDNKRYKVEMSDDMENKRINISKSSSKWETHMFIPVSELKKPKFQRPTKEEYIEETLKKFDPRCVNEIKVSYRDGIYWVVDGMHTKEILERHYNNKHHKAACQVFYGYSYVEDALLFAKQNEDVNKVKIIDRLKALKEGQDKTISDFYEITENCGFVLDYKIASYHIKAIRKALDIFELLGKSTYERMLKLLSSTWKGDQVSLQQNMLGGLAIVLACFGDEISNDKFINTFSLISPIRIIQKAKWYRSTDSYMSSPYAVANAIVGFNP